jgi:hypothetical protein
MSGEVDIVAQYDSHDHPQHKSELLDATGITRASIDPKLNRFYSRV